MDGYELLTQLLFVVEYQRADTYQYYSIFGNNRYSFLAEDAVVLVGIGALVFDN